MAILLKIKENFMKFKKLFIQSKKINFHSDYFKELQEHCLVTEQVMILPDIKVTLLVAEQH